MSDICDQIRGVSYKPDDVLEGSGEGSIGILRANNISDGKINFDDLVYVKSSKVSEVQMLHKGDILACASSGSKNLVGKAAQIQEDCPYSFGAFCKVIRPKIIHPVFLGMYFQSALYRAYISGVSQGANINNIRNEHIDAIMINEYTPEKQEAIAELLQKVSSVIDDRKTEITVLDTLIKARFVEMFGSKNIPKISLEECCKSVTGGGTPSMTHPEYYGGDVPFIKSGDVRGDSVSTGVLWLTKKALEETTAKYIPAGSVLVVNRSAALLREFRAAIAENSVVINQDIKAFVPKDKYLSSYLLFAIKIQTQYLLTRVTTVLTSHIDLKDLLNLPIPDVPFEEQKKFANFIAQVDKSKFAIQKSLDETQLLFDSLMQEYFG